MNKFLIPAIPLLMYAAPVGAQDASTTSPTPLPTGSPSSTSQAQRVVVQSEELDISRESIVPNLGATRYTVGPDRIDSQAQGEDAPFNQTILRFPAVAQDSFGQLHVRGDQADFQYPIDDVLRPASIPGFRQEWQTRLARTRSLGTGDLPAQRGSGPTACIRVHTEC